MGNGRKDRGWTQTFVVSPSNRGRASASVPQRLGWNNRDKTRAASVEPATGKRAARVTWKRRHDNRLSTFRACNLSSGALKTPHHLTEVKDECGCVKPEDAPSQDWVNLVRVRDWAHKGAVQTFRGMAPITPMSGYGQSAQGSFLTHRKAVESIRQRSTGPAARW